MTWVCHACGAEVPEMERVGRRDGCLRCGNDLRCCSNCRFYDAAYHNQCREPQAERQVDKQRGNFCEYFSFASGGSGRVDVKNDDTRARLEALFKGKEKQ